MKLRIKLSILALALTAALTPAAAQQDGAQTAGTADTLYVCLSNGQVVAHPVAMIDSIVTANPAQKVPEVNPVKRHEAVDLGLSVRWADMNVGAESPEQYGSYFAWGEISEKTSYSATNYDHYSGGEGVDIGEDIAGTGYDAAHMLWGGEWRMPSLSEMSELITECTWTWTTQDKVQGYTVTGPNGNSIFLPAAGYRDGTSTFYTGTYGYYWISTYYSAELYFARFLNFDSGSASKDYMSARFCGYTVRAVCP